METMGADAVFIDTNILIYAKLAASPFHHAARTKLVELDEQGVELWLSRQVLREYLAAMTRPGTLTAEIPAQKLVQDVRYFANRFRVAEDGAGVTERLLDLLERVPCGGKQVHDTNLVATMMAYGLSRLLTHNTADFARFASIVAVIPLQDE